ncbi:MAG: endonuclease/exonuclease/phosphatase family protein [Acidimicrobiia bacterium]
MRAQHFFHGGTTHVFLFPKEGIISEIIFDVASFNIRTGRAPDGIHAWIIRKFSTLATIKFLNCNIVALQEAHKFQLKWLLKKLAKYSYVGNGRDGGSKGEHCPILFDNEKFRIISSETKWYGDTPDQVSKLTDASFPRIYTKLVVNISNDTTVEIFNTHLDEKSEERRLRSIKQLAQNINPDMPTIVLGDFNSTRLRNVLDEITSCGLSYALDEKCGGTTNRFSKTTAENAIDHIFVSKHFKVLASSVVRKKFFFLLPSDHWPIIAKLKLI